LPAISLILISSRAWAHSWGVEVFLRMLTAPNLFCKVDSVCFLHSRSSVLQLEVCMAHTPYVEPRKLFIQSYQLLICAETTPVLLSTKLFEHSLQLVVWGGLKCKVECQPDTRMCQAIHFLIPCWFLPVGLDISRAEGRNLKNDHLRLAANMAQMKIT